MEKVVLVNPQDEVLGQMEKMQAHENGLLHRAFSVFLFNEKGEMLLQKRAEEKYHSPNQWTNACCSHPRLNESYLDAAKRRIKEELGIDCELTEKFQTAFPEQDAVEETLLAWLSQWLQQVLDTPILATSTQSEFRLKQLTVDQHLAEFPFYLALSDRVLAIQRIHQLFAEYQISMPDFKSANAARYLNGSIDLVFFDGKQYQIADYKSNFLGQDQQHYTPVAIQQSMSHASYWLQAALYLVALHRYLKVQLQDYQIERDLGGASYLYLRGMNGQAQQGYFYWKPSAEFILRLDAILGYFAEDKISNIA